MTVAQQDNQGCVGSRRRALCALAHRAADVPALTVTIPHARQEAGLRPLPVKTKPWRAKAGVSPSFGAKNAPAKTACGRPPGGRSPSPAFGPDRIHRSLPRG